MPKISVIISTYNQPEWLRKVLFGYKCQTFPDFEIIIADDGFQKTKILNKAILKTQANYLLFTDGDCIPRKDFVETHYNLKRKNCFLSGGYFKLPEGISKSITDEDIENQNCFDKNWLLDRGLKSSFKLNKLMASGLKERLLNTLTPTKATWDGMNASGWKADIIKINGFDERMQYGGEDRELGERLMNLGIKPVQIRYSAICVHLFHTRAYKNETSEKANLAIRKETKSEKSVWTDFGILKK